MSVLEAGVFDERAQAGQVEASGGRLGRAPYQVHEHATRLSDCTKPKCEPERGFVVRMAKGPGGGRDMISSHEA
jgi:hypothetical protein